MDRFAKGYDIAIGHIVIVRITPEGSLTSHGRFVEPQLCIVMIRPCCLLPDEHFLSLTPQLSVDVWLKESSFFRIEVGHEANTTTQQVRMRSEHPFPHAIHGVGKDHIAFHIPQMVVQRVLSQVQCILHNHGLCCHFYLCPFFQFVSQKIAHVIILHSRYCLQQNRCSNDNGQAGVILQKVPSPLPPVLFGSALAIHTLMLWLQS